MRQNNNTLYCDGKLKAVVYLFDGKCRKCNVKVRIKSVRQNDNICIECETGIRRIKTII